MSVAPSWRAKGGLRVFGDIIFQSGFPPMIHAAHSRPIGSYDDMNGIALGDMPGDGSTTAQGFIVGVRCNDKNG